MRVFVTGATGYIGKPVLEELLRAGHQVIGLARSDESSNVLKNLGAESHRGSLEDLDSLRAAASASDGVIHIAFGDVIKGGGMDAIPEICRIERAALGAIGSALAGSNRPLVVTDGALGLPKGIVSTEDTRLDMSDLITAPRGLSTDLTLGLALQDVRSCILRLPPINHGENDHLITHVLIETAREKGVSAYIGDGANHWPATHKLDAAVAYRLALEKGVAGSVYHAVAEQGIPTKEIARIIGESLGVPVVSVSTEEAKEHFGWLAWAMGCDIPVSSEKTRAQLDWEPIQVGLLEDIKETYLGK
ncbi:flavonol reductase [Aulographum hederae CBS 113979]|uniref:Flavonol reductase n=1 Tax=Aulographum hederae CBS 113979 TaxID=1176131 RepID=A0A6G1GIZ8_9PEZI|nr:flavonol reductase [Aulographum hederae CBS 113979]